MNGWIFESLIYKFLKYIKQVYYFSFCHKVISSGKDFLVVILKGSFLEKISNEESKFLYIAVNSYIIRKIDFLSKRCTAGFQAVFSHSLLMKLIAPEENPYFNLFKVIGFSLLIVGVANTALLFSEIGDLNLSLAFFNLVIFFSALLLIGNRINWELVLSESMVIKFIDNCCNI